MRSIDDDSVTRFTRAALSLLSRKVPLLAPVADVERLPPSEGSANVLVRSRCSDGDVVVKLRVDPRDDGSGEGGALQRLPDGLGPRLLARSTAVVLRAEAARAREHDVLRSLDLRLGGVLVLEHLPGAPPRPPLSDDDVTHVASCIARLHRIRVASGPRLRTGSSPGALIELARVLARDVERFGLVDAATLRALQRALPIANATAERVVRLPRVRALCHGDLRWHNFLLDDDDARVLDLEHAGLGDPAVDLALMAARTPLDDHDELRLLDAYLEERRDPSLLDRYFALRPLVSLVGALAAVADLGMVAAGRRACAEDHARYVERRRGAAERELEDVLSRVRRQPAVRVRVRVRGKGTKPRRTLGTCAVDGTASSGKSVLARALAERHGVPYFNTGAVYRYAALLALEERLRPDRADDIDRLLTLLHRERPLLTDDGGLRVGPTRLEESLYVHEIDLVVARFAALPSVREAVAPALAPLFKPTHVVVEGRDAGSVLLPRARHRLYIDASLRVRAERTLERLGRRLSLDTVERSLAARDRTDRSRQIAPLVVVQGAHVIDTTRLSERAAVARVLALTGEGGRRS